MATAVFDEIPWANYSYSDVLPVAVLRDGGPFDEARVKLASISRRKYTWNLLRSETCSGYRRIDVDDFLVRARDLMYESFYVKDPRDFARTGVTLTQVSGLVYTLPTSITSENYRDYPIDDGNVQVYDGGSPANHASVDTDGRTITLSGAPGGAVTGDYHYYRLCRLDGEFTWTTTSNVWAETAPVIVEIVRD